MIRPVTDLIEGALAEAGLQSTTDIWRIAEAWTAIVGAQIAARATPSRLARGELVIATPDAVWRQEISLLAPEIVVRVNRQLGRSVVERIRLVAGDPRPPDEPRMERRLLRRARASDDEPAEDLERSGLRGELEAAFAALARVREQRLARDGEQRRAQRTHGAPRRPML